MSNLEKKKIEPVKLFFTTNTPEEGDEMSGLAPIIFIPGFFSTNRTYGKVKYKIGRRTKRKIYTIDLRNHGKSEYSKDFTLPHCLADLEKFMEEENIAKAILAGHSMGGRLALAMALKHPDKIEKLIVEDIDVVTTKTQNEEFIKAFLFLKLLNRKLSEFKSDLSEKEAQQKLVPLVSKFWPRAITNFSNANIDFHLPFHKTSSGNFEWEINMDVVLELQNHLYKFDIDLSDEPVYPHETLLLAGDKSLVGVQDDLTLFYKYFPKLECRVVENGYHTYHVEFPDVYVKAVSTFIGE